MIRFITWYFPVKFLLTVIFVFTHAAGTVPYLLVSLADSIIIPIVVTIINLVKRKKLRVGEYKVKPEGRRL